MDLVKGLNRRGVYVGLQHITDPQFAALAIPRHRLGAVILIACQTSSAEEEFMEQVNMFIRSVSNMQTRSSDGLQYSTSIPIAKFYSRTDILDSRDSVVGKVATLRDGRSGVRTPVKIRFSVTLQTSRGAYLAPWK
jgi:hypothetical protein